MYYMYVYVHMTDMLSLPGDKTESPLCREIYLLHICVYKYVYMYVCIHMTDMLSLPGDKTESPLYREFFLSCVCVCVYV